MAEGVVVDAPPVTCNEGGHQQDQCALWLMEVGYQRIDYPESEARDNYNPGAGLECVKTFSFKVLHDCT